MRLIYFILVLLCSGIALAGDLPSKKTTYINGKAVAGIEVDGEASETVKPDVAILSLAAQDVRPTMAAAMAENARLSDVLLQEIKKLGVDAKDIVTENLVLEPQFTDRHNDKGDLIEHNFTGYYAFTMYRVHIHNVDDAPKMARHMVDSGSNFFRGLAFHVETNTDHMDQLRAKAIENALHRATLFAQSAGLKLGQITEIDPASNELLTGYSGKIPGNAEDMDPISLSVPANVEPVSFWVKVRITWELQAPAACQSAP